MAFHRLVQARDLYDGFRTVVRIGRYRLLVIHHRGRPHVVDDACPHQGFPLASGTLQGDSLVCPRHGLAFRLADGLCHQAGCRLTIYRTSWDGVWLGIDLPE